MAKVRDYHKLALDIIDVVGGQKNIVNATRCATRLRLVLKETPEGAKEKVSALAGVITVVENKIHLKRIVRQFAAAPIKINEQIPRRQRASGGFLR